MIHYLYQLNLAFTRSEEHDNTNRSKMMTSFLPCVHDELKDEFLQECDKWLVLENTNLNEKTPGLLKCKNSLSENKIQIFSSGMGD